MNINLSKLSLGFAASVTLLAASSLAFGQESFVQCSSGGPVKNSYGECVIAAGGAPLPDCLPAQEAAAAPAPAPAPTVTGLSLDADVFFDFDRSDLKPAGQSRLSQLASEMSQASVQSVDIVGHTDSIGSEAYNQGLSERRAQSAADYLVGQGVNPGVISARGAGELQPIADNSTADGRARNRRVDITVVAQAQ